ncbi:chemotaxis protein methyltransferase CheR [alpha proteobacterium U9-1i]|nr:chemotaxis protein methyltransferase CheR [alpha proteobacterium U9-1i]
MLSDADLQFVTRECKARSGAVLTREMAALIEQRLTPIARRESFSSVSEFVTAARTREDGKLAGAIADALIQSETRFFRDRAGFAHLRDAIPALAHKKGGALRILCAGASTGQEAYSIAMLTEELRQEGQLIGAEIIGIDASERLLDKARSGLYTQFEVQRGLPIRKLIAHFEKAGDLWRISDRMRARVRFERVNLLETLDALGRFDLILCANVLAAFDAPTRLATLDRLGDVLEPHGLLVLGQGEALPEGADSFAAHGAAYGKSPTARAAA